MGKPVHSSTASRQRLKEKDPVKYSEYLEKQKRRAQLRRQKLKEKIQLKDENALNKMEQIRQQNKARAQVFRDRHRQLPRREKIRITVESRVLATTANTRSTVKQKRDYWREYKREYRKMIGSQKKRRIREKDREYKKKVRLEKKRQAQLWESDGPYNSRKAYRNAVSRARSSLPKGSARFASVVSSIVTKSSPSKRDILARKFSPKVYSDIEHSMKSIPTAAKKAAARVLKKYTSQRRMCKEFRWSRNTVARAIQRVRRKPRQKRVNRDKVSSFFKREDVSRQLPGKRYARKEGAGYVLQMSLRAAFAIFKKENVTIKISFSTFCMLRPKNVKLISMAHRDFCLCVYCSNVKYKLLVLNRHVGSSAKIRDENDLIDVLLCDKSDTARFHKPECVGGKCKDCKDYGRTLKEHYQQEIESETEVSWNRWERKATEVGNTKRVLVTKTGSLSTLLEEFVSKDITSPCQGTSFVEHLFKANWQYKQYNSLKGNLPENTVLAVIDFAKNRNVFYQDEIKEAFYGQNQITIHPIVMYYKNNKNELVKDVLICISNDRKHDFHAVKAFMEEARKHLQVNQVKVEQLVIFSDGCSSQYKCRGAFADMTFSKVPVNRNFYGSEHGKGESDGETGMLNRAIDRAIVGRKVTIQNGQELFEWCRENLEIEEELSKRHFAFFSLKEIQRNRPYTEVNALPGCRKIHQVHTSPDKPYELKVRNLSCFCKHCRLPTSDAETKKCLNKGYIDQFTHKTLTLKPCAVSVEEPDVNNEGLLEDLLGDLHALDDMDVDLGDCDGGGTGDPDEGPRTLDEVTRLLKLLRGGTVLLLLVCMGNTTNQSTRISGGSMMQYTS